MYESISCIKYDDKPQQTKGLKASIANLWDDLYCDINYGKGLFTEGY
jgi:hypothetical protein